MDRRDCGRVENNGQCQTVRLVDEALHRCLVPTVCFRFKRRGEEATSNSDAHTRPGSDSSHADTHCYFDGHICPIADTNSRSDRHTYARRDRYTYS